MDVGLVPFLKWAGGKRWLAERLKAEFDRPFVGYREPFLGSGAVFFRYGPTPAVLSDMNSELIDCYRAIAATPKDVADELSKLELAHTDAFYYEIRGMKLCGAAERAARFLYLNRTCWNGLYRVNLKGEFNVPRGTKDAIVLPTDDFAAAADLLNRATVRVADFEDSISEARPGELIFADPPYTVAHNRNGFIKYNQKIFSWDDQRRLAAALLAAAKREVRVIVTNADHDDVRELYRDFPSKFSLSRHSVIAGGSAFRKATTELLVTNTELKFGDGA
ncbi:MAG: Dam family site-specific DNA-(adenine-N6)-methyltransferase [Alphaproteobacteria bacterium]|nr:Dam family site-specific DNA-(adenine-N6)-methyltransferase [Alphaproteobacteria bacterium]MBU1512912.1 Dam family site-specific DNA-(adenine-N6)-methyltransferase [Alphaproteobacteria bacterium]MBU2096647.1 Dam family site-specific DNA-(adenine-N6)-methyltransferase [Alphaproteobacteria bacterium]MBU2150530.1 Dam family site-specific DNA-(adenine-N6)-methyltransferase [Alphaproteobacteria bacterium]MBU2306541.1 Dam family site-specific DNA-(adenine-N6)-methyltransferase [Alphaproteobacteria